jgi:hypothetical protein
MGRVSKVLAIALFLAASGPAQAALAPNGDTVWVITTDTLFVTVETTPSDVVTMTLTHRSDGGSISAFGMGGVIGSNYYAAQAVFDVNSYYGFMRLGVPPASPIPTDVGVSLTDDDSLAFAGLPAPGPPPVNPPPLSLFEQATVSYPSLLCGGHDLSICQLTRITEQIRVLPENRVTTLLLGPLALLALRRKRAPEA